MANAYTAAQNLNSTFKLFLSFDMTALACASSGDAGILQKYITTYAKHSNQLLYNNSVLISTFSGEHCTFGNSSVDNGWTNALKVGPLPPVYFVPSFFVDPRTFSDYTVIDGIFSVSKVP